MLKWGLLGLLVVAARMPGLGSRSWWIDELITAQIAARPLIGPDLWDWRLPPRFSLLGFTLQDTGPGPLTYLLEGLFAPLAKPHGGEFWIRLPGVLAAWLTAMAIATWGRRWWLSSRIAFAISAATTVLPPWVDWSLAARGYMWIVLLAFAKLELFHRMLTTLLVRGQAIGSRLASLFAATSMALFLLTPLDLFLIAAFWVAAFIMVLSSPAGPARRLSFRRLTTAALLVVTVSGLYLGLWLPRLNSKLSAYHSDFSLSAFVSRSGDFVDSLRREPSYAIFIGAAYLLIGVMLTSARWRRRLAHRCQSVLMLAIGGGVVLLAVVLLARFFLVPRYFAALSLALIWSSGHLLRSAVARARLLWGRIHARRSLSLLTALFVVLLTPSALYYAGTPVHDWRQAVRWLDLHIGPDDVIFCGPNADIEVLWTYAQPLGWDRQIPRWLVVEHGRRLDVATPEALQRALQSGRRLWFVTPYLDRVRPPEYWNIVHRNFRETIRFPGRGELFVLVHDPEVRTIH